MNITLTPENHKFIKTYTDNMDDPETSFDDMLNMFLSIGISQGVKDLMDDKKQAEIKQFLTDMARKP